MTDAGTLAAVTLGAAIVGGTGSTWMSARIERGKLKRERDITEADRKRTFVVEALEQSQASLLALYTVALNANMQTPQGAAALPSPVLVDLNERRAEAIRWTDRLYDDELRTQCGRAIISLVANTHVKLAQNTAQSANEVEATAIENLTQAQQGITRALRSLYT